MMTIRPISQADLPAVVALPVVPGLASRPCRPTGTNSPSASMPLARRSPARRKRPMRYFCSCWKIPQQNAWSVRVELPRPSVCASRGTRIASGWWYMRRRNWACSRRRRRCFYPTITPATANFVHCFWIPTIDAIRTANCCRNRVSCFSRNTARALHKKLSQSCVACRMIPASRHSGKVSAATFSQWNFHRPTT